MDAPLSSVPSPEEFSTCIATGVQRERCAALASAGIEIDLWVDHEYQRRYAKASTRLATTLRCVNALYQSTGMIFRVRKQRSFDPAERRHDLRALLRWLRHSRSRSTPDHVLAIAISAWDQRMVYSKAGREVGLAQGASAVVPAWPRVENDCVILAHELGHLVGAIHVRAANRADLRWIMAPSSGVFYLPDKRPIERVLGLFRFHPRNAESLFAHRNATFSANRGTRLSAECAAYQREVDTCWKE